MVSAIAKAPRAYADWAVLLQSVANGNRTSLAQFYDASNPQVFGLVGSIVGEQGAAEEVTLDVYLQVWRQASRFDGDKGSAVSWLLLIARSRAIDFLRSRAHKARALEDDLERTAQRFPEAGKDPESAVIADSEAQTVRSAVAELAAPQRSALELAYFQGLSHQEIADRLALPLGTVKDRIRSAMMQLRAALEPLGSVQ